MRFRLVIPVAFAVLAVTGCGSDSGSSGSGGGYRQPATTKPAAAAGDTVNIADFKYAPEKLTVQAGSKVTFVNTDKAAHTATAQDMSFDTKTLDRSAKRSVTLDKAGTYKYYCAFHRFMEGEIVVK
jgi:plastocyanin